MKNGIFEVFGNGKLGLKAENLNRFSKMIMDSGATIPGGFVIATDIFEKLIVKERLTDNITADDVEDLECPDFIADINETILKEMGTNRLYAIRSSALSEEGGIGIYKTVFFIATGDWKDDLDMLWYSEARVYASEFTMDAKMWRQKTGLPIGMAILIQPVVGMTYNNGFSPVLSGLAYTSLRGLPTVQAVIGLGTKAVLGEGLVLNSPIESSSDLMHQLLSQGGMENFTHDSLVYAKKNYEETHARIDESFEAFNKLFDLLADFKNYGNFYLEWAVNGNEISILQCSEHKEKNYSGFQFDGNEYFHLLTSKDIVNSGRASCKQIIFAYNWNRETADNLEYLNSLTKDYLLVISDMALSQLSNCSHDDKGERNVRLSLRHFSNASAIVERQLRIPHEKKIFYLNAGINLPDHVRGRGSSHFLELCNRFDILFIGSNFDASKLFRLPNGKSCGGEGCNIIIWEIEAEVIIDGEKKEGDVFISKKTEKKSFMIHQIISWSMFLRDCAIRLEEQKDVDFAGSFYTVHYSIGNEDPSSCGPYYLEEEVIEDCGGPEDVIRHIDIVLENGPKFEGWSDDLKYYLNDLKQFLKTTI